MDVKTTEWDNLFTVQFSVAEIALLGKVTRGFKRSMQRVISDCVNTGISHYMLILKEICDYNAKRQAELQAKEQSNGKERAQGNRA